MLSKDKGNGKDETTIAPLSFPTSQLSKLLTGGFK